MERLIAVTVTPGDNGYDVTMAWSDWEALQFWLVDDVRPFIEQLLQDYPNDDAPTYRTNTRDGARDVAYIFEAIWERQHERAAQEEPSDGEILDDIGGSW